MTRPAASYPIDRDDRPREDHFAVLDGLTWSDYERLLEARGEHSGPRLAFDQGTLEITSPGPDHERVKSYLGRLLEVWAEERGVDLTPMGSWTLKQRAIQRGIEPDECYVVGDVAKALPDLAIEVVWTSGGIDKLGLYAALGVGEVWSWRGGVLRVFVAADVGGYVESERSALFPGLDLHEMLGFLDRPTATQAQRAYRRLLQG